MKIRMTLFLAVIGFFMLVKLPATHQNQSAGTELTISLSRDFGYAGSGEIQGTFSVHVKSAPANIQKVAFFMDNTQMGEDTQSPFALQFTTDIYPEGTHTISAVGYASDQTQIASNKITAKFVSASAVPTKVFGLIGPLLAVIALAIGLGFGVPFILERRRARLPLGAPRKYGVFGGTICPKCGRPFSIHLMKLNMGLGALDYCPHCGKWSVIRSMPIEKLRAAEAAELEGGKAQVATQSEDDKLKKELDDSRFQNM